MDKSKRRQKYGYHYVSHTVSCKISTTAWSPITMSNGMKKSSPLAA